jgi:hypothetical protein
MKSYSFIVVCITDSGTVAEKVWSREFDNAVEAVKCFDSFKDHDGCVLERVVTLTEPTGFTHSKVLKYPYKTEKAYEEASARWRNRLTNTQSR